MGNVYIIISDLHDMCTSVNKNRYNYLREISHVKKEIIRLIEKYKAQGYNVVVVFLGDIFDRSYKSVTGGINSNNYFVLLNTLASTVYSVVGNHETTYYKENPFWTLVTEIESTRMELIRNKSWAPKGIIPLVRVVDRIEDGNVVFYLNHHGTGVQKTVAGKYNIGLFHQSIVSNEIYESAKSEGRDIFEGTDDINFSTTKVLRGYDYAFFGHMHKLYGKWEFLDESCNKTTILHYLGSEGRPNQSEVSDDFLERCIPAVIVRNGEFVSVEDNKFSLLSRGDCIDETVVRKQQENYEKVKLNKATKQYYSSGNSDPIANINNFVQNDAVKKLINCILNDVTDSIYDELIKEVDNYGC